MPGRVTEAAPRPERARRSALALASLLWACSASNLEREGANANGDAAVAADDATARDPEVARYAIEVTNGIDCCTFFLVAKSDPAGDYCAVVEFSTFDADRTVVVMPEGTVFPGSESCIREESPWYQRPLDAGVVSESLDGTIEVAQPSLGFDVALTLRFARTEAWVPAEVRMQVHDLSSRVGWRAETSD